ncbi:MAG: DUF4282 domain-containing protein [Syntrophobacterales bacterium]|nr:DUF4282 domain-containing protein [Syntrophobacterales bacterium]
MRDFLTFRTMLTPLLIQAVFWVGAALAVVVGLACVVRGLAAPHGGGPYVFWGLVLFLLGPLVVRLYCEIFIVFFRINETLTEIRHVLEERIRAAAPAEGPGD